MSEVQMQDRQKAEDSVPEKGKNLAAVGKRPGWWFFFWGSTFPLAVVLFELASGACGTIFFDPMPRIWHVILAVFVPCANFLVWLAFRGSLGRLTGYLGAINGAGIVIALYYTLLFVPMMPMIFLAIVFVMGLIPLAPLFSLIAAFRGAHWLAKLTDLPKALRVRRLLAGVAAAAIALMVLDVPPLITRILMNQAVSTNPQTRLAAVKRLRIIGDRNLMLRSCYFPVRTALEPFHVYAGGGLRDSFSQTQAQEIYYRVTGKPYNVLPRPKTVGGGLLGYPLRPFDRDLGGEVVGGRVTGLELNSSRIDGSLDGDAAVGYLEWTLQFKNTTAAQQEARAQISLPPGGVVSRVTLWINGEEREAAFAGRGKVREAYTKVVKRRRDPLLVTSAGPDRVLLQCFPVPPNGGVMRIRIGITTPLILPDTGRGLLRLPYVTERNFNVDKSIRHLVWVEAKNRLMTRKTGLTVEETGKGDFAVRGELSDADLWGPNSLLEATRVNAVDRAWSNDLAGGYGHIVLQTIEEREAAVPDRVVLVVDGSAGMARYAAEIAEALRSTPKGLHLSVVIAGDASKGPRDQPVEGTIEDYGRSASRIEGFRYRGGSDNVPALARAWDTAAQGSKGMVVWVHAGVPVVMENPDQLRQRWDRRPEGPELYDLQVSPGPNRVLSDLDRVSKVKTVARMGTLKEDLTGFLSRLRPGATIIESRRERLGPDQAPDTKEMKKASDHLVRLWAGGEISRLSATGKHDAIVEAVRLASTYHLVTPVSGAVVLETAKDFEREGLTPANTAQAADKMTVPTVPEPETWMLMGILAGAFLWAVRQRRTAWAAH
jgi:hypothetical protein